MNSWFHFFTMKLSTVHYHSGAQFSQQLKNSICQKGDVRQVSYWGHKNIRLLYTIQLSCTPQHYHKYLGTITTGTCSYNFLGLDHVLCHSLPYSALVLFKEHLAKFSHLFYYTLQPLSLPEIRLCYEREWKLWWEKITTCTPWSGFIHTCIIACDLLYN